MKCHLNYATEVWSPSNIAATRWILQQRKGQQEYKDRLVALDLLPLCYDRELKDLTFFYGHIGIDISNFVSFVNNVWTSSTNLRTLKKPYCRTSTFQSSYFNRIVKLWNKIILVTPQRNFSSLLLFKRSIKDLFKLVLNRSFDFCQCLAHGLSCLTVLTTGNQIVVKCEVSTVRGDDIPR